MYQILRCIIPTNFNLHTHKATQKQYTNFKYAPAYLVVAKGIIYRAMNRQRKRVEIQDHARNFTLSLNVFVAF